MYGTKPLCDLVKSGLERAKLQAKPILRLVRTSCSQGQTDGEDDFSRTFHLYSHYKYYTLLYYTILNRTISS